VFYARPSPFRAALEAMYHCTSRTGITCVSPTTNRQNRLVAGQRRDFGNSGSNAFPTIKEKTKLRRMSRIPGRMMLHTIQTGPSLTTSSQNDE